MTIHTLPAASTRNTPRNTQPPSGPGWMGAGSITSGDLKSACPTGRAIDLDVDHPVARLFELQVRAIDLGVVRSVYCYDFEVGVPRFGFSDEHYSGVGNRGAVCQQRWLHSDVDESHLRGWRHPRHSDVEWTDLPR